MTLGEWVFLVQLGSGYANVNLVRVPSLFCLTQDMYDKHHHSESPISDHVRTVSDIYVRVLSVENRSL